MTPSSEEMWERVAEHLGIQEGWDTQRFRWRYPNYDAECCQILMTRMPPNSDFSVWHFGVDQYPRVRRGVIYRVTMDIPVDGARKQFDGEGQTIAESFVRAYYAAFVEK